MYFQGRNQPIPIRNEHELAHLFLSEFYKKQKSCSISSLDIKAILRILSSASCFPKNVKMQAQRVEDKVRELWNLTVYIVFLFFCIFAFLYFCIFVGN